MPTSRNTPSSSSLANNGNDNDKRESGNSSGSSGSGSGSGYMKRQFVDRSVSDKSYPDDFEPIQINNNNSNHSNNTKNRNHATTRNQRRRDSRTSRGSRDSKGSRQSLDSTGIRQPANSQESPILLDTQRALVKPPSRRSSIGTFSPESGGGIGNATNLELSNYHTTHGSFPTSIEDAPPSSFLNSLTMANIFNSLKSSLTNSSRSMLSSMSGGLDTSAIMKSELENSHTDKFDDDGNFGSNKNESDNENDGSDNFSHSVRGLFGDSVRMNPAAIANSTTKITDSEGSENFSQSIRGLFGDSVRMNPAAIANSTKSNEKVDQSFTMSLRGLFGDSVRGFGGSGNVGSSSGGMDLFNSTDFANDNLPNPTFDTITRRLSMNNGSNRLGVSNETTPLFTIVDNDNIHDNNPRPSALGASAIFNNNKAVGSTSTKNPRAAARASARAASASASATNQPGAWTINDVVSSAKLAAAALPAAALPATATSQPQQLNYGTTTTTTAAPTPMMATISAPGYQEGNDIVSAAMEAAKKVNMPSAFPNNNNTTTTPTKPHKREGLVQSKLKNMSMSQRQRGMFDLHGMSEVATEDPAVIQQCLIEMNKHIIALYYHSIMAMKNNNTNQNDTQNDGSTDTGSSTLGWAYTNYPEYVGKEKLKFLRANSYQPKQAVQAMSVYYEKKRYYFGLGNLCQDITMELLTDTDLFYYKQGGVQLLEGRDRSGRTVSMSFGKRYEYVPIDSAVRVFSCFVCDCLYSNYMIERVLTTYLS